LVRGGRAAYRSRLGTRLRRQAGKALVHLRAKLGRRGDATTVRKLSNLHSLLRMSPRTGPGRQKIIGQLRQVQRGRGLARRIPAPLTRAASAARGLRTFGRGTRLHSAGLAAISARGGRGITLGRGGPSKRGIASLRPGGGFPTPQSLRGGKPSMASQVARAFALGKSRPRTGGVASSTLRKGAQTYQANRAASFRNKVSLHTTQLRANLRRGQNAALRSRRAQNRSGLKGVKAAKLTPHQKRTRKSVKSGFARIERKFGGSRGVRRPRVARKSPPPRKIRDKRAIALKAWKTRLAKYGPAGRKSKGTFKKKGR